MACKRKSKPYESFSYTEAIANNLRLEKNIVTFEFEIIDTNCFIKNTDFASG